MRDDLIIFRDRREAGRLLGARLAAQLRRRPAGGRPLVLALPRGGLPVGQEVARAVGGDLDVVVARKIGLPGHPEFGIGAVAEHGPPLFHHDVLRQVGLSEDDLAPAVARERAEVGRRVARYRADRPPPAVAGRTVVVVDDGLATGVTATAALRSLRSRGPGRLVYAAPVCAADSAALLADEADEIICYQAPSDFRAVGAWYDDFAQLTDEDVEAVLSQAWAVRRPPRTG